MTSVPDARVLLTREEIALRVGELGKEISAAYEGSEPVLVAILKGSAVFLADLARALSIDARFDFMSISSYSGEQATGVVRIVKDLEHDIEGRDVVIVEDIVDTGLTLNYLRKTISARDPRSLSTVTLLDKAARRILPVEVEWRGFEIPDAFVLGYGLDYHGLYRNVKDLLAVSDISALVARPDLYVDQLFPHPQRNGTSPPSGGVSLEPWSS